ncbi:helix-turn-helix transcriptional regulator [Actomonas aquatica]|uniref:AraC family transcriptional regulator n=1 Tax=Actomonas aquatica TaxID=2866162 RepID=A0ABZ1CE93_9BACT|nr:AraC family transcriptional regulator [Opitutus sp. WL0086]WRQ90011.1 AraC family transcriptional regulator [Opitutus sp. WL0086]
MLPPLLPLRETHIVGPHCVEWVLSPERFPQLRRGRFAWIGHSELRPPYRMVRIPSAFAHIVVCTAGEGRCVIDGKVVPWRAGQALLAPSGRDHGFEAVSEEPWHLAWVFAHDREGPPLVDAAGPQLIDAEVGDFADTVRLMVREAYGEADPATMQAWVSLLQTHTLRLTGGPRRDPRLIRLWREVEADLARPWDVTQLAQLAAVSEEHLRRLCRRYHRRTPAAYLTRLRMHRAGVLLRATNVTVEAVAEQIGFGSVHAFSTAFKRWSGVPPSTYRQLGDRVLPSQAD